MAQITDFLRKDTVKGDFERLEDVQNRTIPAIIPAKNRAMVDVNRTKYYDATDGLTKKSPEIYLLITQKLQ